MERPEDGFIRHIGGIRRDGLATIGSQVFAGSGRRKNEPETGIASPQCSPTMRITTPKSVALTGAEAHQNKPFDEVCLAGMKRGALRCLGTKSGPAQNWYALIPWGERGSGKESAYLYAKTGWHYFCRI